MKKLLIACCLCLICHISYAYNWKAYWISTDACVLNTGIMLVLPPMRR